MTVRPFVARTLQGAPFDPDNATLRVHVNIGFRLWRWDVTWRRAFARCIECRVGCVLFYFIGRDEMGWICWRLFGVDQLDVLEIRFRKWFRWRIYSANYLLWNNNRKELRVVRMELIYLNGVTVAGEIFVLKKLCSSI